METAIPGSTAVLLFHMSQTLFGAKLQVGNIVFVAGRRHLSCTRYSCTTTHCPRHRSVHCFKYGDAFTCRTLSLVSCTSKPTSTGTSSCTGTIAGTSTTVPALARSSKVPGCTRPESQTTRVTDY